MNAGQEKMLRKHTAKMVRLNSASQKNSLSVMRKTEMFALETRQLHIFTASQKITRISKVNEREIILF